MRRSSVLLASTLAGATVVAALATTPFVRDWHDRGETVLQAAAQVDDHSPRGTSRATDERGAAPGMRGAVPLGASLDALSPEERSLDGSLAEEAVLYLEGASAGTYIDEVLAASDSLVTRWPLRDDRTLTYWVQAGVGMPEWTIEHRRMVDDAFREWDHAGLPLRLVATSDSASANMVVLWRGQFDEPISGKTRWTHDRRGWIRSARVTIALHRFTGETLASDEVRAITLHEIGHAIGLDHTMDPSNVMAPKVRVRALSEVDRATAQLLYRLPAGSLKR